MAAIPSGRTQRSVTRRLTRRYVLALSIVAVLTIFGQVTVQVLLARQTSDAQVVSTAAFQITLSERMAKDVLAIQGADNDPSTVQFFASDLATVVSQLHTTQLGLRNGDPALGLPGNNSLLVTRLYSGITPNFNDMLNAATSILVAANSMPPVPMRGTQPLSLQIAFYVQEVLIDQPAFVNGMNAVTAEYQLEAEERVSGLKTVEYALLGAVLVVLILLGVVVFRPVTNQVGQSVAELVRAQEREHELAALKDQFIIDANHELRTPIMALYNNLEILQALGDRAKPEQRATILRRALTSGDAVLRLLTNVLDTGALEGKPPKLDPQPVVLAPLVRQVLETFDPREIGEPGLPQGEYEGRPVTVSIKPDLTVVADEARLRQILINLLANALKYSSPGTPIEIQAGGRPASHGNALAQISVRDHGLGVPPADVHKLFNRFVRLERDIAGPVRGTGVGLYMCRVLVEAMGGQIWVDSSGIPGEGSTFSFTLPILRRAPITSGSRPAVR